MSDVDPDFADELDLIGQLANSNNSPMLPTVQRNDIEKIDAKDYDKIDDEVVQASRELMDNALSAVNQMTQYATASNNAADVESLAKLISAASATIDNLQKHNTSKQKMQSQKELKQMDIDSKKQRNDDTNATAVLINREEVLAKLLQQNAEPKQVKGDVIEDV